MNMTFVLSNVFMLGYMKTNDSIVRNMKKTIISYLECMCNELGGNMARFTQFPIMITRSTIIYEIVSPGAAGSSIYV